MSDRHSVGFESFSFARIVKNMFATSRASAARNIDAMVEVCHGPLFPFISEDTEASGDPSNGQNHLNESASELLGVL